MEFILQRYSNILSGGGSSQGVLLEKDTLNFCCHTIEDEGRQTKVMGETRIWAGFYELKILKLDNDWTQRHRAKYNLSGDAWFTFPIEITNVKDFSGVLIHVGYGEKDTEGCVLLADTIGNNTVDVGNLGGRSMDAVKRFYKKVYPYLEQGGKVFLEIRNENYVEEILKQHK